MDNAEILNKHVKAECCSNIMCCYNLSMQLPFFLGDSYTDINKCGLCNVKYTAIPLSAMTLLAGFMMALSAEMGLRMGVLGSAMSMITT